MVKIINHRGANLHCPENTFAAANLSVEQGADFVELDVRESLDGELFVIHDYRLERTTNGVGPVNLRPAAELDRLSAGHWHSEAFKNEPIPRFSEFAENLRGRAGMQLEIKSARFSKVLKTVENLGFAPEEVRFCTFSPEVFLEMSNSSDRYERLYYLEYTTDLERVIKTSRVGILEIVEETNLTPQIVETAHKHGITAQAYVPGAGADATYHNALDTGVDFINVDDPALCRRVLNERGQSLRTAL